MSFLVTLLGHVASYGLRAEDACRALIEKTIDECMLVICEKTGLSSRFLTHERGRIYNSIMASRMSTHPVPCQGRTRHGIPCKKKTYYGYCADHADQGHRIELKKRRLEPHGELSNPQSKMTIDLSSLRMMRYQFP